MARAGIEPATFRFSGGVLAVAHPLVPNARAVSPEVEDRLVRLRETLACLPSSRAGLTVEDTITSSALDLVAQCDRVIAAKGGLFSEVR